MQIRLPNPSKPFEQSLVIQLTKYLNDLYFKLDQVQGYKWDGSHPIMGEHHFWIDATDRLRIKKGQPLSDTDGVVVGTQS